ncbi:hypothetical protein ED733_000437 [Metarhizium rileyi]|uniref:Protein kinase-like domain protein n=1 Tax=Metarhizium rileyi (strain RCEF 4871) TaxID=1649241 RepID=A0A5C6G3F1_METRR|nr:hypothetical protein ED733_000437 [Metarhizium rileyi]
MANNTVLDYERLIREAEERTRIAEERQHQAEERQHQAEEQQKPTNLDEFVILCHTLFRRPRVAHASISTKGTIPLPKRKYCPARLVPWLDCQAQLQSVYDSVRSHLQAGDNAAQRVFPSAVALKEIRRRTLFQRISSEQGLLLYDRLTREDHILDIITQLCDIPAARQEFDLGDGIEFESHKNALEEDETTEELPSQTPTINKPVADVFTIRRVDGEARNVILTCEQKPPHKLPVEIIRLGIRPMFLFEEMVKSNKVPTDETEKTKYVAARLVCSALVQTYHVMIQEGLTYSYLTIGPDADLILWVPRNDPGTLHYHLSEPSRQNIAPGDTISQPITSVTSILCLLIMSLKSRPRSQGWRNWARSQLNVWETKFDSSRSATANADPPRDTESNSSETEHPSPESGSEYLPSSSPLNNSANSANKDGATKSRTGCAPTDKEHQERDSSPDSSASDASKSKLARKRGFSNVSKSCQPSRQRDPPVPENYYQPPSHDARFCSQLCILGLQNNLPLDDNCPNVALHRCRSKQTHHSISAVELLQKLKEQLDDDIDANCTPFAHRGAYAVPFKLTLATHGYTIVGKGTTSARWGEVSKEIQVYKILQKSQGAAVPVFLGAIDLAKIYFVSGAGDICHMLVMSYGGEILQNEYDQLDEFRRSIKEIKDCGIIHEDLRSPNILWNKQTGRVVIIDFHRVRLIGLGMRATRASKRKPHGQSKVRQAAKRIRA